MAKVRVKMEFVIDYEDKTLREAIREATYHLPKETRSVKSEAWPLKSNPVEVVAAPKSLVADVVTASEITAAQLCPCGCGHPISKHAGAGCLAKVPKGTGMAIADASEDFCPCDWKAPEPALPKPVEPVAAEPVAATTVAATTVAATVAATGTDDSPCF